MIGLTIVKHDFEHPELLSVICRPQTSQKCKEWLCNFFNDFIHKSSTKWVNIHLLHIIIFIAFQKMLKIVLIAG